MAGLSAVILDLDGLMIDTERVARRAWKQAASDFGHTMDETLFSEMTGRRREDVRTVVMEALGDEFPYAEVRQRRDDYFREAIEHKEVEPKPGLFHLLGTIEELGLKLAIATSGHREVTFLKLSAIGLRDRFETVVCGDDIEHGKPAPDIFLDAARRLGVPPSHCVVLEDSDIGARAADAAGMRVIVVPGLESPAEDVMTSAWRVLPSLHAAARQLEEEALSRSR